MDRRKFLGASLGTAALWIVQEGLSMHEAEAVGKGSQVKLLGSPCQARNINSGIVVRDQGRDWLVLGNMNESSHMELIFIDPERNEGQVYRAPAGSGSWALQRIPGNRIAVGTYYDGVFMVFDVSRREWVKTIKFPGEEYLWTFCIGKDGRVYGGTYPGARLGALDPETLAFEDLGAPSKENLYLRYTSALPDGRVFCQCGFTKPETLVFDPATKRFTPAPADLQSATQGVSWNGYFVVGDKAYRMPDLAPADPLPFPTPDPKDGAWAVDIRLTTPDTLVLRQGYKVWRVRAGESALTLWADLPHRGLGGIFGADAKGALLGVRGQDFFRYVPGDKAIDLKRIPGEAASRATMFLHADDRGRLWGGPTFGQTLFYMDVATGKVVNTGVVSDHGGEVYDVEVIDGICYAVSYSWGEVIRFDPEAAWDQVGHVNPKTIARVGPDYIRPEAGLALGPDGRLYSGWLAKYGSYGGALAITDPGTGKTDLVKDPLGPHGLSGLAIVGSTILLGSTTYGNGLGPQKGVDARFGVYDLAAGKTTFTRTMTGAPSVSRIVYDPKTGLAAFLAGGMLWMFDAGKGAFVGDGPVLKDKVTSATIALKGSRLLYGIGEDLHARDLATGRTSVVARAPGKVEHIAVGPKGEIYLSHDREVYQVLEA